MPCFVIQYQTNKGELMPQSAHSTFKKLLLAQLALIGILSLPLNAEAQRQRERERDREGRRDDFGIGIGVGVGIGQRPGQGSDFEYNDRPRDRFERTEDIRLVHNERVQGQTLVRVLQLANQQGDRLRGKVIRSVSIEARALGRFAQAEARLLVNGRPESAFEYLSNTRELITFPLYGQSEVGRDLNSLQIEVRGDAQIRGVVVTVEDRRREPLPAPALRLRPQRDFYGVTSLRLDQAFALPSSHMNRLVSQITFEASSINGGELGLVDIPRGPYPRQYLSRYSAPVTVYFDRPIPLRDIGINMLQHVRVETVEIHFLR